MEMSLDERLMRHNNEKARHRKTRKNQAIKDKKKEKINKVEGTFLFPNHYIRRNHYTTRKVYRGTIPEHKEWVIEGHKIQVPYYDENGNFLEMVTKYYTTKKEVLVPEKNVYDRYIEYKECEPYVQRFSYGKRKKNARKFTNRIVRNKNISPYVDFEDYEDMIGTTPSNYRKFF